MKIIESKHIVYFDVDDTLLMWRWQDYTDDVHKLLSLQIPGTNETVQVFPHLRHIELMKQFKVRGQTVVVWSKGGWDWAHTAIKALKIEQYVDLVLTKPDWYIDDLDCKEFMKDRRYLHPTDRALDNFQVSEKTDDN